MRRTIEDVDGDEIIVSTEDEDCGPYRSSDEEPFDVLVDAPVDGFLADLAALDALIAALQEAREEIAERRTVPSPGPAIEADC